MGTALAQKRVVRRQTTCWRLPKARNRGDALCSAVAGLKCSRLRGGAGMPTRAEGPLSGPVAIGALPRCGVSVAASNGPGPKIIVDARDFRGDRLGPA
jgi:hypothetical protein